ncbi:hotdog fold thioesterase [Aliagarivorans marinus]|uniref:hotdog fold thioesterase n=1 Tax=Aliagarivorans marinus TaxID=561965 RepID=UPI000408E045|nr:hotdog fold thioesterase [Aliagarivorans marinus]
MSIWAQPVKLEQLNAMSQGNMLGHLDITFTEVGDDYLCAEMPVTAKVKQPMGLLHGGASVVLAESLASCAAYLTVEQGGAVVGLEVNANHMKAVRDGVVTAKAKPLSMGRQVQVWQIDIFQQQQQVCAARLTTMIKQPAVSAG